MKVRFLVAARDDPSEAVEYYNRQRAGLGTVFREEARAAVDRIRRLPAAWHPLSERTRRCLLHRFPYGIIYHVRHDEILIVAVAHLHRDPEHWQKRLDSG